MVGKKKPQAFVLMPFVSAKSIKGSYPDLGKDELDTVFSLIKETLSRRFSVKRADSKTDILREIIFDLDKSDLVVADLTSLNPNVMYELGIRHGFCKKTILITQDRSELPFDISGYHCVEYKWITKSDKAQFKQDILSSLDFIENHDDPRYGPVHTHLGIKKYGYKEIEYEIAIRKLYGLLREVLWLQSSVQMCVAQLSEKYPENIKTDEEMSFLFISENSTPEMLDDINSIIKIGSLPCADLFVSENYIPEEFDVFNEVSKLTEILLTLLNSHHYQSYVDGGMLQVVDRVINQAFIIIIKLITALENGLAGQRIFEIEPNESIFEKIKASPL